MKAAKIAQTAVGTALAAFVMVGCSASEKEGPSGPNYFAGGSPILPGVGVYAVGTPVLSTGNPTPEAYQVCKSGSGGDFSYSIVDHTNANTVTNGTLHINDGQCYLLFLGGGPGATVTVTETATDAGFHLDHVELTLSTGDGVSIPFVVQAPVSSPGPTTGPTTVGGGVVQLAGAVARFVNVADEEQGVGRITGGGSVRSDVYGRVTYGFTLHCDILLSNNLEVNWPASGRGTNNFHITRPLTSAICNTLGGPPNPPAAPFNRFIGVANGSLNGVDGAVAEFTLIDNGEPGTKDWIQLKITSPTNVVVLNLPLTNPDGGNIQAHFDQPHGNKK